MTIVTNQRKPLSVSLAVTDNGNMEKLAAASNDQTILVKRFASGRRYDVSNGRSVSVEQLRVWAAGGVSCDVIDHETAADLRRVLPA